MTKGNGINGSTKRTATTAEMSPLVGTTTAAVVAAASAVMTVPTKTWHRQLGGTFTHENMQQSIKQQHKNRAYSQLENIRQSIKLTLKTRTHNNQQTMDA